MEFLPPVSSFEIRFHKSDGSVSLIMTISAFGPEEVKLRAFKMLNADLAYAIIWLGMAEVATVHRDKPN